MISIPRFILEIKMISQEKFNQKDPFSHLFHHFSAHRTSLLVK